MILDDDLTVNSTVLKHAEAKIRLQSDIFKYLCCKAGIQPARAVIKPTIYLKYKLPNGQHASFPCRAEFKISSFLTPAIKRKGGETIKKILNKEYSKVLTDKVLEIAYEKQIPIHELKVMYNR